MASRSTLKEVKGLITDLEKQLNETQSLADDLRQQVESAKTTLTLLEKQDASSDDPTASHKEIRNAIYDIFRGQPTPIHYRLLRQMVEHQGLVPGGVDRDRTIAAHLSNDPRFQSNGAGYWGLSSWPSPEQNPVAWHLEDESTLAMRRASTSDESLATIGPHLKSQERHLTELDSRFRHASTGTDGDRR